MILGNGLSEDEVKNRITAYLEKEGWKSKVAEGKKHGIDIEAIKDNERWVIEVKGNGSRKPMRTNYFLAVLGEILQRMDDENTRYSIAFPNLMEYKNLWNKLPQLAKERTRIDMILVDEGGEIYFYK